MQVFDSSKYSHPVYRRVGIKGTPTAFMWCVPLRDQRSGSVTIVRECLYIEGSQLTYCNDDGTMTYKERLYAKY